MGVLMLYLCGVVLSILVLMFLRRQQGVYERDGRMRMWWTLVTLFAVTMTGNAILLIAYVSR